MALTPGTRLGVYEITVAIGEGGMGQVYRATDTKLKRQVAIKILPPSLAADHDRLARFQREAQVLASLNHPNIAAIYGLEESGSVSALVMELVEGEDLSQRIERGAIPLDEALPIAMQVAEALEASHEQGIIHRDLKPANIKVRPDGTVKVLDFGLAKALDPLASSPNVSQSPTITTPAMTQAGVLLGTAAYMSPEQARGKVVDKRSDVWAFGAVLYEILSGQRAFKGEDIADTIAAVLRQEVDWIALPASTPTSVRRLLERCLNRDVRHRLRDIGEARIVLAHPAVMAADAAPLPTTARPLPVWRRTLPLAACALIGAALAGTAVWYRPLRVAAPQPVTRFPIDLPDDQVLPAPLTRHAVALSPDGTQLVYVANDRLYRRSMSDLTAREIQGSHGFQSVSDPAFSPDGRSIAFYATIDRTLKTISVAGGAAATLGQIEPPFGVSWESDRILFGQRSKGILQMSLNGGTPTVLVGINDDEEAQSPQMLPDGQHVLFTLASGSASERWNRARVMVQSIASGERKMVLDGGSEAHYVPTGHLVYAVDERVFAMAFDVRRLEVSGSPLPVLENVWRSAGSETGASQFTFSPAGSLAYLPSPDSTSTGPSLRTIALVDRTGAIEPVNIPPGTWIVPRVSPDGRRIAFGTDDGKEALIYTYELSGTSTMQRLTFGGRNRYPIWGPDSRHVVFQSDRDGDPALFSQSVLGGAAERLTRPTAGEAHAPESWSGPADRLLFSVTEGSDVSLRTLSPSDGITAPFGDVHSAFPVGAVFSPDGKWVAYTSTERGVSTIYVQPFPATGNKVQLITKGSQNPHAVNWASDGNNLFYVPRFRGFESVRFITKPAIGFGNPVEVPRPFQLTPPNARTSYDITPSGKFLTLMTPGTQLSGTRPESARVQVVLNWLEELKQRVPTK